MAFNWAELKTDWKTALSDPKTTSNVNDVVEALANALKKQLDAAVVTGTDSRGDQLTNGKIQ